MRDLPLSSFTYEELLQVSDDNNYPLIIVMKQSLKNVMLTFALFTFENGEYNGIKILKQCSIYKGHMYALNEVYGTTSQFRKDD